MFKIGDKVTPSEGMLYEGFLPKGEIGEIVHVCNDGQYRILTKYNNTVIRFNSEIKLATPEINEAKLRKLLCSK